MPHVTVKMYPGSTDEQKKTLSEAITIAIVSVLNKPEDAISIAIDEIPENDWMEKVYEKEIRPIISTLYKKPGY